MNLPNKFNINGLEEFAFFGGYVKNQSRFCEADPLGACSGELIGEFCISGDRIGDKVLCLLLSIVACETEERISANDRRNGFDSGHFGLDKFLYRLDSDQFEFGCIVNFWNNIMIVRIEPFFHRERLHVALFALVAVGSGKVCFENAQTKLLVAFRDDVKQECGIENVVVKREIVGRDVRNLGFVLFFPTVETNLCSNFLEFCFGDFALEEFFASKLEFTILADTRETNYRSIFCRHINLPTFFYLFS